MTTQSNLCRLCVDICQDSKSLYDENGRANELYDIIYKYFHPTVVNMDEARHLTGICLHCWRLICEFNSFQTVILRAQLRLMEGQEGVVKRLKQEDDYTESSYTVTDVQEIIVKQERDVDVDVDSGGAGHQGYSGDVFHGVQTIHITRPKLEIMDVNPDSACSSDAEMSSCHFQSQSHEQYADISSAAEGGTISSECNRKRRYQRLDDLLAQWMPVIKCVLCPESYTKLSPLQYHFAREHPHDEFYLSCCSRKLMKRVHIKEHLLLHSDPNAFKCEFCSNSYATMKNLRRHVARRHPETECKKFVCRICDKGLKTKGGLKLHYIGVHNTEPQAEAELESEEGLDAHTGKRPKQAAARFNTALKNTKKRPVKKIKIKQRSNLPNSEMPTESEVRQSATNSKIPPDESQQSEREIKHETPNMIVLPKSELLPTQQMPQPLEERLHLITTNSEIPPAESHRPKRKIKQHEDPNFLIIPKSEVPPAQIPQPPHGGAEDELVLPEDRPVYTCNECEKISYTESSFYHHMWYNHRHEPRHNCSFCGKTFKRTRDLQEHMATHQKIDLYACAFCPLTFRKLNRVSEHRKTTHPLESNKKFYKKINEKTQGKTRKVRRSKV